MQRRILTVFLAFILIFSSLTINIAQAEESTGWALAFALIEKETGYMSSQLKKGNLVYGDGRWAFSVTIIDHPVDEDGLLVGEMDAAGNIISLSGPTKISLEQQLVNDLKNCFNREDCYLLLADVCKTWNEKLEQADESTLATIWDKYLAILQLGITSPPSDALAYNMAYDEALRHLAESEGWTDEMAHMFRLCISAYYVLDKRPVYFFYFERHSYFENDYSTDKAMDQYENSLTKAFSDIGQAPPFKIGIIVSAETGELLERPMLDYAPVQYHYLDFLIRTDEAVASIAGGE